MGNIEHPTSNAEHPMFRVAQLHWMLVVRCWMLDVPTFFTAAESRPEKSLP